MSDWTKNIIKGQVLETHFFGKIFIGFNVKGNDLHAKTLGDFDHIAADATGADYADGFLLFKSKPRSPSKEKLPVSRIWSKPV